MSPDLHIPFDEHRGVGEVTTTYSPSVTWTPYQSYHYKVVHRNTSRNLFVSFYTCEK